jgi:hypothetical protein
MDMSSSENCSEPFIRHEERTPTAANLSRKMGFVVETLCGTLKEEIIVTEVADSATGLHLKFPNAADETYARAQEFRRLSPEDR